MCLDDPIADFAEALYGGSPNVVIVFDDQNRLLGRSLGGQLVRPALCHDMFGNQSWKINLYRRPLSDFGVDLHVAATLLDEAVNLAETKSRALADRLGREERFESLADRRGGHPDAGIGNADGNILPR